MDADASVPYRRLVHVPYLDVLRAFAVSIVVLSHIWEVAPYYHWREIFSNSGFLGAFAALSLFVSQHPVQDLAHGAQGQRVAELERRWPFVGS